MEATIKIPVTQCLQEVFRSNRFTSCQVGDSPRNLQDPVVGPSAEIEISHGILQQLIAPIIETAVLFDLRMGHPGVAGCFA
jgi:hypothetical protein